MTLPSDKHSGSDLVQRTDTHDNMSMSSRMCLFAHSMLSVDFFVVRVFSFSVRARVIYVRISPPYTPVIYPSSAALSVGLVSISVVSNSVGCSSSSSLFILIHPGLPFLVSTYVYTIPALDYRSLVHSLAPIPYHAYVH